MGRREIVGWLAAAGILAPCPSCTRLNPAYEDGGDTAAGSASSGGTTTVAPSTTTVDTGSPPDTDPDGGSGSGGSAVCGNGFTEPGEDCDDGNLIDGDDCDSDCLHAGGLEWIVEFQPRVAASAFHAAGQLEGDLLAAGWAQQPTDQARKAVVVRFDRDTGDEITVASLDGDWLQSEAHGLRVSPSRLFIAGTGQDTMGTTTAFAACFDVGEDIMSSTCWTTALDGDIGHDLLLQDTTVLVPLGGFGGSGHGAAALDTSGAVTWSWFIETAVGQSQFEIMTAVDGEAVVGGMMMADAVLAFVGSTAGTTVPFVTETADGTGQDCVRALVAVEGELLAGGFLDRARFGRDPWVGRYTTTGTNWWSWVLNGGSLDTDQVEAMALDPEGFLVAVGRMGETRSPRVWKIDPADGNAIWTRTYPELGPDATFHGVVVDEAIFVVGERAVDIGSVGIAARLKP